MQNKHTVLLMLLAIFTHESGAQNMPNALQIEQERQRIEAQRKPLFDPNNLSIKNAPNVFPNIATPQRASTDIETIAHPYKQKTVSHKMDELMIFISFTMPRESLQRLIIQANQVGASLVLNGFKNNRLKATAQAIKALGEQSGNVLINPKAFIQYKIKAVPTFVLTKIAAIEPLDKEGCALPDQFVSVSGDVSLDYALDEIAQRAPTFETAARRMLRQIRKNP